MSTPAGLEYLADVDGLAVKLFRGETVPVELVGHWVRLTLASEAVLPLHMMWGKDDGRLYSLTIAQASQHIPPAVLRNPTGLPLQMLRTNGQEEQWLLPLFPEASQVGRNRASVDEEDDERHVELLLAKSGRVVAILVPADRLPIDMVG